MNALDLFSGAGGFTLGLAQAGFRVLGAVDSWPVCVQTYTQNFAHPCLLADCSQLSPEELLGRLGIENEIVDLVVGGPPCQGFSVQRIGRDEDQRNELILDFARLTAALQPRMFLMENVPGLLNHRGKALFSQFCRVMAVAGYQLRHKVINAADYGVPQVRRRVFVCGWLSKSMQPYSFPAPTVEANSYRTVWDAIGDLPSPPADYAALPHDLLHRRTKMSKLNAERLRYIPAGGGFESLPKELRVTCHQNGAAKVGHRNVYGRLAPDQPASTITARFDSFTRGKFAHPFEDRNITLREGARLQTFPDFFQFSGNQEEVAAQIGNAVPPLLSALLCQSIAAHFSGQTGRAEPQLNSQPYLQSPLFSSLCCLRVD